MRYIKKDITTVTKGVVAHGVNCQRVMGSGVALAIRNKWPKVYQEYLTAPKGKESLGGLQLVKVLDELFVANCFTQEFYGRDNKVYADKASVRRCLWGVVQFAKQESLPLYLPKIASDRGGLSWEKIVEPMIKELELEFPEVDITICLWP